MTDNKRFSFAAPPELEDKIIELRKTDEFCRMTFSEIIRALIEAGIKQRAMESETAQA